MQQGLWCSHSAHRPHSHWGCEILRVSEVANTGWMVSPECLNYFLELFQKPWGGWALHSCLGVQAPLVPCSGPAGREWRGVV